MAPKLKIPGSFLEESVEPSLAVRHLMKAVKNWQSAFDGRKMGHGTFSKGRPDGLKVLFYGKSDTEKAKTVAILGKEMNQIVYRVDLAQVISDYIEGTKKKLDKIFDLAKQENWILYFDEAEALFGKRTTVSSSHDRYANQEIAYLLERVEAYPGIIVLSSSFKKDIDPAFLRRLRFIIDFPFPKTKRGEWIPSYSPKLKKLLSLLLKNLRILLLLGRRRVWRRPVSRFIKH